MKVKYFLRPASGFGIKHLYPVDQTFYEAHKQLTKHLCLTASDIKAYEMMGFTFEEVEEPKK